MRALALQEFGAAPAVVEVDTPTPGEGEVLVRVGAAAVNGFDEKSAAGFFKEMMPHDLPLVPGLDLAGEVVEVGPGVTSYAVGDRVFGMALKMPLGHGTWAEYVAAPTAGLVALPDDVDDVTAAAHGLASIAARTVLDSAGLGSGDTALVTGATGGVGVQLVQLLPAAGVRVIATARDDSGRELLAKLGVDEVVDYTDDLAGQVKALAPDGVDAVIHLAGDPAALAPLLKPGGPLVSPLLMSSEPIGGAEVRPIAAQPTPEILAAILADQQAGRTRVEVQRTYSLDEAAAALDDFRAGTRGKLVVRP